MSIIDARSGVATWLRQRLIAIYGVLIKHFMIQLLQQVEKLNQAGYRGGNKEGRELKLQPRAREGTGNSV